MDSQNPNTLAALILLVLCLPTLAVALMLDRRRREANPETLGYRWGYYSGLLHLLFGGLIALGSLAASMGKPGEAMLGVVAGLVFLIPGYYTIKRRRWAWVVHTLLTLNFVSWIINWIYGSNRWEEFGREAELRARDISPQPATPRPEITRPAVRLR